MSFKSVHLENKFLTTRHQRNASKLSSIASKLNSPIEIDYKSLSKETI